MPKLKEIQDQVVEELHHGTWELLTAIGKDKYWPEICKRYAQDALDEAKENAKVKREQMINWDTKEKTTYSESFWTTKNEFYQVDKSSITAVLE